jgi:hypothetical protein
MIRDRNLTIVDLFDLDTNVKLPPHLVPNMATRQRSGISVKNLNPQNPSNIVDTKKVYKTKNLRDTPFYQPDLKLP